MINPSARRDCLRWLAAFALANGALLVLLALRYLPIIDRPETVAAKIFLVVSMLGHFPLLAVVAGLPLGLLALVLPRRALIVPLAVILYSLLLCAVLIDTVVYSLYRFHLNGMVWSLIVNGGLFEILPLSLATHAVVVGSVVVLLVAEVVLARVLWRVSATPLRWGSLAALAILVLVVGANLMHAWADAVGYTPVTRLSRSFPAFRPMTAEKTMSKLGIATVAREKVIRVKHGSSKLDYPQQPLACDVPARPLNILLIVIDAWRYDMLTEAATPNVWALGRRSVQFPLHTSAANTTRFGIFNLFYGIPGTYWHDVLSEQRGPVLIQELERAGYQFGIFGSARLTNPEFDRTVFTELRDRIEVRTPGETVPERDLEINRRFLEFLVNRDAQRPFFGFLFYDATHAYAYPPGSPRPFLPEAETVKHLELKPNVDPLPVRNRFLNALHFVDSLVGEVLARMEADSLLSNTVILVTGDHGQEFNDLGRNFWGHNGNFSRYQASVPMLVYWPGREPATAAHVTSHLDVAPTILREILNCETPVEHYSEGFSLFDPTSRAPLVAATWDGFALLSPGRVDVVWQRGYVEHYDEDYQAIESPLPPGLYAAATREISRFYAR